MDKENVVATGGTFEQELASLVNRYSMENKSNTPDFILAKYIEGTLKALNEAIVTREVWYGRESRIAPSAGVRYG